MIALGVYKTRDFWSAHGLPWVLLFILWLSYYVFIIFIILNAIVKLHAIDENTFYDFIIGKWKWIKYAIKAYLKHDLHLIYAVEAFKTLTEKT